MTDELPATYGDPDFDAMMGLDPQPEPARGTVTAAELADYLGVTAKAIRTSRDDGVIPPPVERGRYDLRESIRAYCRHVREQAAGRGNASAGLTAERERHARAQADKIELHNAAARGELVSAVEVEKQWAAILRDVRAAMLAVPSRIQQQVRLSAHDVAAIDREIRDVLGEIADGG